MPYKNKEDRNTRHKQRMAEDPGYKAKRLARSKRWAENNPDKVREKNRRSARKYSKVRAEKASRWRTLNSERIDNVNEQRKLRVLTHYGKGGGFPLCCWEECSVSDPDMLSIDHIDNDGKDDRGTRGTGSSLYRALEKEGYPEGFQTLCHNHQWKKEILRRRVLRKSLGSNSE